MDVAREVVGAKPTRRRRRLGWAADNPLVRGVGRVPLPLGAKLIAGFGVIAALLAVGYALGIVALGQSNSRGTQLRRLQEQAVYEELLLTDSSQLKKAIDYRLASSLPARRSCSRIPRGRSVSPSWRRRKRCPFARTAAVRVGRLG